MKKGVDAAVVPELQGQPGAASAVCFDVQPWKLLTSAGVAEECSALVVDHATGEADQDRGEGGPACEVRDDSVGGSGGAARVVRRNL